MKSNETICIAWAHTGTVDTQFALDMITIVKKRKQVTNYFCVNGTGLLAKSRNLLVKNFLDNTKDDWLLMLDDDESIPLESFDELVKAASQDRRVVAGLYFAALWNDNNLRPVPLIFHLDETHSVVPYDNYPKNAIFEIVAAGTGCLLIHRSVLVEMQKQFEGTMGPDWAWFQDGPIGNNKWLSEDLMFCSRLNSMGIKIYANTAAKLGHHKSMWVTEDVYNYWEAANQAGTGLDALR